jgi:hypothetical protein
MLITIAFTEPELNVIANALNIAVKTEGMPAAVAVVPIFEKLRVALEANAKPDITPVTSMPVGLQNKKPTFTSA